MTKIFDFARPKAVTSTQDDEIWRQLRQSLHEQFPNPQRDGCPGMGVLKRLAQGAMPLDEAEAWLDHFSQCSPCFRDFGKLQLQAKHRRKMVWSFAATAAIALCSSLALWLTYGHEKEINAKTRRPGSTLAQIQQTQPPLVSLHLEDVSANRDTDNDTEANLQRLPRGPISLSIYLPPGSEGGTYEIAFLHKRTDSAPLARFKGIVQLENGAAVLRTTPDTSALEPGDYVLAFRPAGGWWRYSRITIA